MSNHGWNGIALKRSIAVNRRGTHVILSVTSVFAPSNVIAMAGKSTRKLHTPQSLVTSTCKRFADSEPNGLH